MGQLSRVVRGVAERLSRNISFRARLPIRFGRRSIYLSPANQLAVFKLGDARFESYLLGFVDRFVRQESVAWDIGANMGIFTFSAAHKAKMVLAVEPDPYNLLLLQRSRMHNSDLNVTVVPAAISNAVGTADLKIPNRGRSANSLAGAITGSQAGGERERFTVMTVTLDWLLERYPAPDIIKCDAEGAETWILQGATKLLAEARPVVIMEMPRENAAACLAIFRANDYAAFNAYEPVDPSKELDRLDEVWEVLAIPREKLPTLAGR